MKDIAFTKNELTGVYLIRVNEAGDDFIWVTGLELIKQSIEAVLKMVQGEWEWDKRMGIPHFDEIMRRPEYRNTAISIIKKQIAGVDGVSAINSLTYDGKDSEDYNTFTYDISTSEGAISGTV